MRKTNFPTIKLKVILGIIAGFVLSGCSDVRLVVPEEPVVAVSSKGRFCISEPSEIKQYTKFLFVIDKSGSNSSTDNGGKKRVSNVKKFISDNREKDYYRYGMIVFAGEEAKSYVSDSRGNPGFTENVEVALAATKRINANWDNGNTPYMAALQMAQSAISHDSQLHADERSTYIVFFVSDGVPTDVKDESSLDGLVKTLVNSNENSIFLSTAYYGKGNSKALRRLSRMSSVGGGKFVNFEEGSRWDFNELVVKPDYEPWQLKTMMVYNINGGFCIDGSVDVDSDGDGMCDKDEMRLARSGFDPANRFSFGDGYGDYFHWLRVKHGKELPKCRDRSDLDKDLLTYCEEAFISNETPRNSGGARVHGDPDNQDTDFDGIIDGIETFVYFTRTRAYAMDSTNLNSVQYDFEEQAGEQIYQHRNPLVRDPHQEAYDADYWPMLSDGVKSCYGFSMTTLPLFDTLEVLPENTLPGLEHGKGENVVLLYYLQTLQNSPNGQSVYRYSYQNLKKDDLKTDTQAGLEVKDEVFSTFVP